jgi:hypothetical protein
MSKALLIIDMPESCGVCPCIGQEESYMFCGAKNEPLCRYYTDDKRPEWCPLIDIKDHMDPLEYVSMKKEGK